MVKSKNDTYRQIAAVIKESSNGALVDPAEIVQAFYPELKRLAAAKMRRASWDHTWQATALVNELYLQLARMKALNPVRIEDSREKWAFFSLAGQVMHWLLARHARTLSKRAGKADLPDSLRSLGPGADCLARVEDLLSGLEKVDPLLRKVVELRVFEELSSEEAATRLGCSPRTVTRHWSFAKMWLRDQLSAERSEA